MRPPSPCRWPVLAAGDRRGRCCTIGLDAKLDMRRNEDESDEWKLKGNTRVEHGRWCHVLTGDLEQEIKNGTSSRG